MKSHPHVSVTSLGLVVAVIGIVLKLVIDFEYIPNLVPVESVKNREYDFIIVGGGTAGCVLSYHLARQLSNSSILLIEAGGIFNGLSIVPLLSTFMQGSRMDWKLKSARQKYSSRGLISEQQMLPRGKGLGGSHQLNYLLHSTGLREDFDEWEKLGGKGWSYDGVINRFLNRHGLEGKRSERNAERVDEGDEGSDEARISITKIRHEDSTLAGALMKAEIEMQKSFNTNFTITLAEFTTRKGTRHSVFHEYLRRAFKYRNLSIMIHARVERIEFNENRKAVAVIVKTKSHKVRVQVKRELILSAGAFHSPHILQLSGVGDESDLEDVGINLHQHLPYVGKNLFDHMNFPLFVSINDTASVTRNKILSLTEIFRYLIDGNGIFSTTAVVGVGNLLNYGVILFGTGSVDEETFCHVANYESDTFRAFFPLHSNVSQEGFVMLSTCYNPKSRGSVKINPEDVLGDPTIDPEYFHREFDVSCLINAVRMHISLMRTEAFRKLDAKIHWPKLKSCENFGPFEVTSGTETEVSDRYLECLIRHAAVTGHHAGGTCALGSVIDENFKVKGLVNVRVVDASVFPNPVAFHPNSVVIALAEKASEIIVEGNQNEIINST